MQTYTITYDKKEINFKYEDTNQLISILNEIIILLMKYKTVDELNKSLKTLYLTQVSEIEVKETK